jgi:hypothetical protein
MTMNNLVAFFKWAMWQSGDWSQNIDGGDLQDKAEELGLIEKYTATEPCCDQCACAEVHGAFPVECYRYTEVIRDAD